MSWEGPSAETGLLAPETDLVTAPPDLGDERGLGSSAPLLAEGTGGFGPELGGNDMTWQSLGAETGLPAAEADRLISSEDLDEEPGLAAEAYSAPVLADGTVGFDPEPPGYRNGRIGAVSPYGPVTGAAPPFRRSSAIRQP